MSTQNAGQDLATHTRKKCISSFIANFLISAGLGYWAFSSHKSVQPWGADGYVVDLLATGFFLSSIVAAIFIITHKRSDIGWPLPTPTSVLQRCADSMPLGVTPASLVIGLLGLVYAAAMLLILLPLSPFLQLTALSYALMKGVWAGVLAMMVMTMAIWIGLKSGK